jgi:hypothetical protein
MCTQCAEDVRKRHTAVRTPLGNYAPLAILSALPFVCDWSATQPVRVAPRRRRGSGGGGCDGNGGRICVTNHNCPARICRAVDTRHIAENNLCLVRVAVEQEPARALVLHGNKNHADDGWATTCVGRSGQTVSAWMSTRVRLYEGA